MNRLLLQESSSTFTPILGSQHLAAGYKRRRAKSQVSLQDIRVIASTLYLKTLPGLEEIEDDQDSLIDLYYQTNGVTD